MAKHHAPLLLPEDIRFFRSTLGMTAEQLGNALGYEEHSIYELEADNADWTMSDTTALKLLDMYLGDNTPTSLENSPNRFLDQRDVLKAC